MTLPDPDFDDELLSEAEAFESRLRQGGEGGANFERQHGDLADVLRLLHDVFGTQTDDGKSTSSVPRPDEVLPQQLGRFQIVSLLGRGGFAVVYRAYDDVLQRDVAIKLIPGRGGDPDVETDKRLHEARAVARLSHPNIIPLFEVHREGEAFCLVSEFCDGPTLGQWLSEHAGSIEPELAAEIVRNLADGVAHAHGRGLAHRDIKPGNVLLAPTGERGALLPFIPRLTDFGLARDLEHFGADHEVRQLAGTWEYMAPEQIRGDERVSLAACDVHALGVVLYRLLAGQQPYRGENRLDLLRDICTRPAQRLRSLVPQVPRDLEAICLKCLAKTPEARYSTAREIAEDLTRWQTGRAVLARPPSTVERVVRAVRRAPVQSALIAAVLLLAAAATILLTQDNRRLAERGHELQTALRASRVNEMRATTFEWQTIAVAGEADLQRQKAESNMRVAVTTAYRADLSHGFEALGQRRFSEAYRIAMDIERYASGVMTLGFDLRLLQALATESWRPLAPHAGAVTAVVPLPGTELLLSAGTDGVVRQHNLVQGNVIRETKLGAGAEIWSLACSADRAWTAVGYVNTSVRANSEAEHAIALLPQAPEAEQRTLTGFPTTVESLAFLPDNRRLAIGCRYEPLQIRSLDDPAHMLSLESNRRNEEVVVSPDGREVTVYCSHRTLRRYDASDGRVLQEVDLECPACHLAGSPDGRWLAVSLSRPPYLVLLDASNLSGPRRQLSNPFGEPCFLAFSPAGQRLAAGLRNGGLVAWDLSLLTKVDSAAATKGESTDEMSWLVHAVPHDAEVTSLAFPNETQVVSGADDGSLAVSSLQAGFPNLYERTGFASRSACLTPDGQTILMGGQDGSLVALNPVNCGLETILPPRPARDAALVRMAISLNGSWLAMSWDDCDVALMHLSNRMVLRQDSMLRPGDDDPRRIISLAFDTRGERLAIVRHYDGVEIWQCPQELANQELANREVRTVLDWTSERRMAAVCFLDTSDQLAYGGQAEEIHRVDIAHSAEHVLPTSALAVTALCYDPLRDGLISGHDSGQIRRYDRAGRLLATCSHPLRTRPTEVRFAGVTTLAISPDGANLLAGNLDGEVSLWDAVTLRHLGIIRDGDGRGAIADIGLSRDGTRLLIHQVRSPSDPGNDLRLISIPASRSSPETVLTPSFPE
ncbi:MAG: WD40 repeat domain-containing serine/threonine-protein kinase [Pirellulaceae bacterium]